MKKLASAIAVIALIGTPAFAAEMAVKMPVKAPPPAPAPYIYNWTGFYIGAHIGYGWDREDPSVVICHCVVDPPVPFDAKGILGGLQAGFNYQFNSVVVGVEGDLAWMGIKGTTTWIEEGDPHTLSSDIKWLDTAAGRVGYAFDHALLFVKGGGAWEDIDYHHTHTILEVPGLVHSLSGSAIRGGWLIGAGAEYAFWQNVSVKIEFDHIDFGSKDITTSDAAGDFVIFNIGQRLNILKTGINYKF